MTQEAEPKKLRNGEQSNKPYGGNVSLDPFPQALYSLALSRGYETQLSLSRALGKKHNATVSAWYTSVNVPSPDELGSVLRLLRPNDSELDPLLDPYGILLQNGRGQRSPLSGSERARETGIKRMRPAKSPFEEWIKEFCMEKKLTIKVVMESLSLQPKHRLYGLFTYSRILQNAPQVLGLSSEETESLAESIAETLEEWFKNGHKFSDKIFGIHLQKIQSSLTCQTYNGSQVAKELGKSRERVRQLRVKYGFPLLMTEDDLEFLRKKVID